MSLTFRASLWRWTARSEPADPATGPTADPSAWCFVTLPEDVSEEVRLRSGPPRGFGSVPVTVTVGGSRWQTSVFPDASSGCFVLPVKKAVRSAEGVAEGDELTVTLEVRE